MTPMQIAVLSIALAGFAGLLVVSPRLRIRPWVVLMAGIGGTALGLLAFLLMSRIHSLSQMTAGVLLVCAAGALAAVAVSLLAQRAGKRMPREALPARQAHALKAGAGSELSGAIASAQGREFALLSAPAARPVAQAVIPAIGETQASGAADTREAMAAQAAKPGVMLTEAAAEAAGGEPGAAMPGEGEQPEDGAPFVEAYEDREFAAEDADEPADGEAAADDGDTAGSAPQENPAEIERLAKGFRKEQERRARVEEKRLEAERLAKEEKERKRERERLAMEEEIRQKEQERAAREEKRRRDRERRITRRGEERRLRDVRLGTEADEAQHIRERIAAEKQKVAIAEQQKLETAVAEATAEAAADAVAVDGTTIDEAAVDEAAVVEAEAADAATVDAGTVEAEIRNQEEDAAAAESWSHEQERLARELEERRREQEKAADDEKRWLMEQERLAREQEERRLEQERLAREQENLAREQEDRRIQQERLAREQEELRLEQLRLEREEKERREKAERDRAEEAARRNAEAAEYLASGRELAESGRYIEALQLLEKAARVEASNEVRVDAGIAIVETLIELGWKGEAIKKMQAMKTGLVIEGENRKRLGELAMKLVG